MRPHAWVALLWCAAAACSESPFGSFRNEPGSGAILGKFVPADSPTCSDITAVGIQQPVGIGNGSTYFYVADGAASARTLYALAVPGPGQLQVAATRALGAMPTDVAVADGTCPYVASDLSIDPVTFADPGKGVCGSSEPPYPLAGSLITFDLGELLRAGKSDRLLERYLPGVPPVRKESIALTVAPERITVFGPTGQLLVAYKTAAGSWDMLAYDRRPFQLRGRVSFPWPDSLALQGLSGPSEPGDDHLYALSDREQFCVYVYVPGG